MQLLFGRNGTVNLLLRTGSTSGSRFMEGLNGVVFVQALHYFPFILINLARRCATSTARWRRRRRTSAARGFRLFRRIVLPLAMPGYIAGASLVFVKVFDDLATPLLLNVKDMLAPQAYLRVTSVGLADPMGYVISVVLIVVSVAAMWAARRCCCAGDDYATVQRGGGGLARRGCAGRQWCSPTPSSYWCCCWCWRRMSESCCSAWRRSGRSARCRTASRSRITPACCGETLQSTSRTR